MKRALILLFGIWMTFGAHAMKLEVQGKAVFATGPVEDDLRKFQEALEKPGVDTVVFVNSPGGDLWTGLRVGRLIADKGLKTVIAGSCVSACSIMFMGGKERTFSDVFRPAQTYIGIHGAHNKDTNTVNTILQPQIFAFYKQYMVERFNTDVMNKALYEMEDSGALLRVFDAQRLPKRIPYHCKSSQSLRKDCTEFKDHDALSLGIVTSSALTPVDLPDGFKQIPMVLGRELTLSFSDSSTYFKNLADTQCTSESCRKLITNFDANKENKALAIAVGQPGLGTASNRDTAMQAFVSAVYACNHIKDESARLCEAQTVNGYDVRSFHATGLASHAEALAKLTVPPEKFYANEEYGGGMTSGNSLRTQKLIDITPQQLDGIRTLGTKELALALKNSPSPVLIDVWAGVNDAIPGAVTLLFGGLAFDDAKAESAYDARFSSLLKLFSPDRSKPVIFYCAGRNCWLSVNASLRAKKLGYTNVGWYRGGMESWRAANLPLASVVINAVAN